MFEFFLIRCFILYISWFRITDILDSEFVMAKTRETILSSRGMHKTFVYWAHQSNFCPLHHYLESCNKFTYMSLQIYIANIFACYSELYSSLKKSIEISSFPYIPVNILIVSRFNVSEFSKTFKNITLIYIQILAHSLIFAV